ncbi:hypothetical protein [Pseudomonas sp. GL-RE-20]|uniref:hypothetical protein n=1 Tax=Pseudomonas sp. GL-RE-20 TaxID=2832372 RepID=UPI001CBEF838|nr:hypothetical protein [Pseudomonas sp. GL-RE-20]
MTLTEMFAQYPDDAASPFADDPELCAALDADFTMLFTGVAADMDRADAQAQQAAMTERVNGGHTLH